MNRFDSNGNRLLIRSQSVEIRPLSDGVSQINFPDIQNLRDVNVWGIEFYYGTKIGEFEELENAPSGLPIITAKTGKNIFVNLVDYASYAFVKDTPMKNFVDWIFQGVGSNNVLLFTGQKINWNKSYLFSSKPADITNKEVMFCTVFYSLDTEREILSREKNLDNRS